MKLLLEELWKELPQGWVMIRRTPNTNPRDDLIEMHFTGDVDLIAENATLKRENEVLRANASKSVLRRLDIQLIEQKSK